MNGRRSVPRLLSAAGLALVAACGSTVAVPTATGTVPGQSGLAPSGAPADGGLSVPSGGVPPGSAGSGTTGTTGGLGGGTSGSGAGGSTGSTGGGGLSGGGTTAGGAATGPGITATKISVGLFYSSDASAADRAIGAAGAAPSYDLRDVYNAVIRYANSHGGFAGRQLSPNYVNLSVAKDQTVQAEAACQTWTKDNKVFVLDALRSDTLRACAEKAGAISLIGGDGVKSTFDRFPHFIDPNAIRLDRLGNVTVGGLSRAGYFTGKVGLVTWDDTNYRYAMEHGYLPDLAARGIKPALPPVYISVPQQLGALGDMTAAVSSAVTKFRSAGINHVIIQDGPAGVWAGGGLTLEWMNQAESQHYRPRYGQNAYNLPGNSELPKSQMDKAIAIMETDDSAKYDVGWHNNPAREKCYKIQAAAGLKVRSSNSGDEANASQACDHIFFIQRVLNSMTAPFNSDRFVQAVEALGTGFPSAVVYGTRFGPGRHDGADLVRTAEYFKSCNCLKYSGPPYTPD
jgi:hypothetical protein